MSQKIRVGIQGGPGSFNEEAVLDYLQQQKYPLKKYELSYLHTTERVLQAVKKNDVDYGHFATYNSIGGIVKETLYAVAHHTFTIMAEHSIPIRHTLMMHKNATLNDLTTIMAHPQVFKQCKHHLAEQFPTVTLVSGEGELIDHALVAQALHQKKISLHHGVIGSQTLAQLYNLQIIATDLQDESSNRTYFVWVKADSSC